MTIMDRRGHLIELAAILVCIIWYIPSSISLSFLNDTQTKRISVSSTHAIKSFVGSIVDETNVKDMRAPFYIVPLQPEDERAFKSIFRIDVDNGHIYANEKLSPERTYSFSALSINSGQAIVVIINVVDKADDTTTTTMLR